jgi:hypothetical protein
MHNLLHRSQTIVFHVQDILGMPLKRERERECLKVTVKKKRGTNSGLTIHNLDLVHL